MPAYEVNSRDARSFEAATLPLLDELYQSAHALLGSEADSGGGFPLRGSQVVRNGDSFAPDRWTVRSETLPPKDQLSSGPGRLHVGNPGRVRQRNHR